MATISYKVHGSYPPFAVELREGSETGTVVDSMVAQSAETTYSFSGVSDSGNFYVVAYDTAFGVSEDFTGLTTTTSTTLPPTTTTTTIAGTTTTTTTIAGTTTTTTIAGTTTTTTTIAGTTTTTTTAPPELLFMAIFGYPPDTPSQTNYNSGDLAASTVYQIFYTTNSTNTQGGTGIPLSSNVDIGITFDIDVLDAQFTMGNYVDSSGIDTSTLPSEGADISSANFTFTTSGDSSGRGWFTFNVLNPTVNPDVYTITLTIGSGQGYVFGLDSDSTDPNYEPSGGGADYGYSALASNFVINVDGEINGS